VSGVAACCREYKLTFGEMTKFGDFTFGEVTIGKMTTVGETTTVGEITFGELTFGEMAFGDLTFIEITSKSSNLLKRVQRLYCTGSAVSLHTWLALIIVAGHNK